MARTLPRENERPVADPFHAGEDAFVQRLRALFKGLDRPSGGIGIGDDAAVLPGRPERVVSTDVLVEGQHFRFDLLDPEDLAVRALEVNLSDMAAMGSRPEAVLLGLAWPRGSRPAARADRLLKALREACQERSVPLVGGDLVRAAAGAASLAVTVIGRPWPGGPVTRAGGRSGHVLAVTGPLGGAGLGLMLLEGRVPRPRTGESARVAQQAVDAYRRPRARLDLSKPLAKHAKAMIDISDGLGMDLPRLAEASGCGFEVEAEKLPLHPATGLVAGRRGLDLALGGGEDYELLAAVPAKEFASARKAVGQVGGELLPIGRLRPRGSGGVLSSGGRTRPWPRRGWDPFRSEDDPSLDVRGAGRVSDSGRPESPR